MGCNGGSFGWYTPPRVAPLLPEHLTPPPAKAQSASIQIELPADAQLTVDGQTIPGTGSTRAFSTPELAGDKAFYYDMTAEITLNGVPHQETVRVVVRGGESVKQTFAELLAKTKTSAANDVARK